MLTVNRTSCCGVREIENLHSHDTAENALFHICNQMYHNNRKGAYIIFSATQERTYGDELRDLIVELDLGGVIKTRARHNPQSNHMLNLYIWKINQDSTRRWYDGVDRSDLVDEDEDGDNFGEDEEEEDDLFG